MSTSIKHWRLLGAIILLTLSTVAESSMMISPHGAGRNADLAGITVAAPDDGESALMTNPAGVVSKAKNEALIAIYPGVFEMSYKNPATGYDGRGRKDFAAMGLWYGLGEIRDWSLGFGVYGNLGAAFNLPFAPEIGQSSPYLGEVGIMNFGFNAGRQLTPDLRFGIQLAPQFGMLKMRMPTPLGDVHLKAKGFGISASTGLIYALTDKVSLGLAYRTPGVAKFRGDAHVGNIGQRDSITFVSPQSITAGLAYQSSEKLRLLSQLVWTRYTDFERARVEFHKTAALNGPLLSSTTNRVRWGVAMEYEFIPRHTLRAGFTSEKPMIADSAVSPMMFDHDDDMLMAGYERDFDTWRLGFSAGYMWIKSRQISVADNPNFPGTYKSSSIQAYGTSSPISVGARVTWKVR
ncbi:conserved protein of unknown function [Georgfuchsia toluolica]|uniref:Uncharacterized protein n=1 Tax=Georgfuchsia toluolica TaxID=424218 RepID=A0A916N9G0_9PROT|nr:outer membrane protein transport protein [Georgfuchsia toluolica]CAG4883900.1 conserved protein of unknown function [Georgfuchsia toluolica]